MIYPTMLRFQDAVVSFEIQLRMSGKPVWGFHIFIISYQKLKKHTKNDRMCTLIISNFIICVLYF